MQRPRNIYEVRNFVGFFNYFKRFVRNYSREVEIYQNEQKGVKTQKNSRKKKTALPFNWSDADEKQFTRLLAILRERQRLAFAEDNDQLIMTTDASCNAIGGCIHKYVGKNTSEQEKWVPKAYFSNKLNDAER
jgi:RNase H-like domain found in reverse transcriptase